MSISVLDDSGERPMTVGDLIASARASGLSVGPELSRLPPSSLLPLPNNLSLGSEPFLSLRRLIELASREVGRRRPISGAAHLLLADATTQPSEEQEPVAGTIISAAGNATDATTALIKAGATFTSDPDLQEGLEKGLTPTERAATVIAVTEIANDVIHANGLANKAEALSKGIAGLGAGKIADAVATAVTSETGPLAPILGAAAGYLANNVVQVGIDSAATAVRHDINVIKSDPDAPTHFFELLPGFPRYQELDPAADVSNDPFTQGQ